MYVVFCLDHLAETKLDMFPLADTLRLPVFPSLRFLRNRTTFKYVSVKFPSNEIRVSASVTSLRKYAKMKQEFTSWKQLNSRYFHREKKRFSPS